MKQRNKERLWMIFYAALVVITIVIGTLKLKLDFSIYWRELMLLIGR